MKLRSFTEAREFVHKLGLKNQNEWKEYAKSKDKPTDIPADPGWQYKKEWKGIGDWLCTGYVHPKNRKYRSFT